MNEFKLTDEQAWALIEEVKSTVKKTKDGQPHSWDRIIEAAVRVGIVVPAENAGMIRDHAGERALHGAAYWQKAAEVAEAKISAVLSLCNEVVRVQNKGYESHLMLNDVRNALKS